MNTQFALFLSLMLFLLLPANASSAEQSLLIGEINGATWVNWWMIDSSSILEKKNNIHIDYVRNTLYIWTNDNSVLCLSRAVIEYFVPPPPPPHFWPNFYFLKFSQNLVGFQGRWRIKIWRQKLHITLCYFTWDCVTSKKNSNLL